MTSARDSKTERDMALAHEEFPVWICGGAGWGGEGPEDERFDIQCGTQRIEVAMFPCP